MTRIQRRLILAVTVAIVLPLAAMAVLRAQGGADAEAIKTVIEKSYFHGAFNELNPDAMMAGFHADFAIFSADGENMAKYPIATWAEAVAKRKNSPGFDPQKNKWDCRIVSLDVTGNAAAAKIELSRDGKLVYTDYLSLLKFSSGWKIAAKVYQQHK